MDIKKFLLKNFFNKIIYLGSKEYIIYNNGKIDDLSKNQKANLVIIGKEHYFETSKSFPFGNLNDIRSAINTDILKVSPFETDLFFFAKKKSQHDSTDVNIWFIDNSVIDKISFALPYLIIPETALLSFLFNKNDAIYMINLDENKCLYAYTSERGDIKSIVDVQTDQAFEKFLKLVGSKGKNSSLKKINLFKDYTDLLYESILKAPVSFLFRFVNPYLLSISLYKKYIFSTIYSVIIMFFLYTGATAFIPYYAEQKLKEEDSKLSKELHLILQKKDMLDAYFYKQNALAEALSNYTYKVPLLNLLYKTVQEGTLIRRISISGNVVELNGLSKKASEFLSLFSKEKNVKNAKFTAPVMQDLGTGMENFYISFVYLKK
ncbi:MAG: PilN domain-containing protein [Desulfobacterales bacterium]|nr:PilN domain-containing protein [Desulfobacterales bacterium]